MPVHIPQEGKLLRIFIGEQDKWQGRPLYEQIVKLAREEKMAGATCIKGFMGFGRKSHLHTATILRLSEDLPIVIEIVDSQEKIERFISKLDEMISEGLVTLESMQVIWYRGEQNTKKRAPDEGK